MGIPESSLIANSLKRTLINNARSGLGRLSGGNANSTALWSTFGYNDKPTFADYLLRYRRHDIAKRIINATVDFTWKDLPVISDDIETTEAETEFEVAVYDFFNKWKLSKLFKRADKLACIGRYSVIVIGTAGEELTAPLGSYSKGLENLAYLNVYSERQATIQDYVTDATDARFGLPKTYKVNPNAGNDEQTGGNSQFAVDASRVIHIAEELLENDIYGLPKLESVYNLLDDLLKVSGGGAEMFFLSAYQGLAFKVQDGFNLEPADADLLKEEIENYVNKVQRFIKLKGVDVQNIGSTAADPRGNFEVIVKLIAGASNIPMRILLGSEQGQLAASVDQDTFFSYIQSRRNDYAAETIIEALLDRLIGCGILPSPKDETYSMKWPELFTQSDKERATVAAIKLNALKSSAPYGEVNKLATVEEVREMLGFRPQIPESEYGEEYFSETLEDIEGLPNTAD
jgi:hypothetical protein